MSFVFYSAARFLLLCYCCVFCFLLSAALHRHSCLRTIRFQNSTVAPSPHKMILMRICLCTMSDSSYSHSHTLTITCTCCYDEIKGAQDLKIYSHAHSLVLTLLQTATLLQGVQCMTCTHTCILVHALHCCLVHGLDAGERMEASRAL